MERLDVPRSRYILRLIENVYQHQEQKRSQILKTDAGI